MSSADRRGCENSSGDGERLVEFVHDLRQNIAAIGALAAVVELDAATPAHLRPRLRLIVEQVAAMAALCESASGSEDDEPFAFGPLAEEVARSVGATSGVDLAVVADAVTTVGPRATWRRIIANLVENAARAAGPGGSVIITVRLAGADVVVEISDSGPGFGHGPAGRAGLGLVILDRLVAGVGGRLEIDVSALGGALVRVVAPAPGSVDVQPRRDPTLVAETG